MEQESKRLVVLPHCTVVLATIQQGTPLAVFLDLERAGRCKQVGFNPEDLPEPVACFVHVAHKLVAGVPRH